MQAICIARTICSLLTHTRARARMNIAYVQKAAAAVVAANCSALETKHAISFTTPYAYHFLFGAAGLFVIFGWYDDGVMVVAR